jgi:error-prone DNA polymerase|nr:MAG: error-prone DNA polymerase [bacterium]
MRYVELRAHTAFSFGDGATTPEALVRRAAEYGYPALGLTDHADLGGVIRFALECERSGVRPVVGAELVVDGHPLAVLAMDERGYRNLAALVTRSRVGALRVEEVEGVEAIRPRGRPSLSFAELEARSEGLFVLTGPASGEIASLVRAGRPEEAAYVLDRWRSVFPGRLAVEVQLHHVSGAEAALAAALIELAARARVPWVVTNDPRYLDADGRLVHDLLTALRAGLDVNTAASWGVLHPNGEWRLKTPEEMARLWKGREAGLEESVRIAEQCRFDLRWLRPPLPRFPVPPGHDDDSYLRELVYAGAAERWGTIDERQRAQLEHELGVIRRLGFAGFFLVMWDAVRFARSRGILCQGRGSAANSAVAYCLGITAVDPVRHGLLFERFLSEVRTDGKTEAPDIDVDFEMHRREEVLNYMYERYRRQHAAIACTVLTYHAPSAAQDAMRALGYPAELALRVSKRLHRWHPGEGADALEKEVAAQVGIDVVNDPRGRALVAAMRAFEDLPRLRATHPGGFVLSSQPLSEYLPIEHTTMGRTIIQFDKDDLDAAGVPKFDFLGLGGLSAVHIAFDAIERRTGRKLELYSLPVDDAKTYEMIARGDTVGTFQLESRAQIGSLVQTKPDRLYDIVVQVALIRPGPIQARFVHPYTRRRRGLEPVRYTHPLLEPILKRTYGIPIFQEQAMAIAMTLGGFSAAEADELRRAMGHRRKRERLVAALQRLRARIIERGYGEEIADEVCQDLLSFANYGFPESHAWSFALIAYATAYLKAHYPAEFLLGLLNSWPMGFYPPSTLVHDARRHGVVVLGPCMRDGGWECELVELGPAEPPGSDPASPQRGTGAAPGPDSAAPAVAGSGGRIGAEREADPSSGASAAAERDEDGGRVAVRLGWKFIRGLGERTGEALRAARADGPFASIEDVIRRARLTRAEALHIARAGAFEAFQPGRRKAAWEALRAAGDLLPLAPAHGRPGSGGNGARVPLPFDPRELEGEELVFLDYLATGVSTHGHPMEHLRARLDAAGVVRSDRLRAERDGARITVAGLVVARQRPETANGTVFVLLEDEAGFINVIVPARLYERNREVVKFSPFLVVEGELEIDGDAINVVGRRFRELAVRRRLTHRSRDFR